MSPSEGHRVSFTCRSTAAFAFLASIKRQQHLLVLTNRHFGFFWLERGRDSPQHWSLWPKTSRSALVLQRYEHMDMVHIWWSRSGVNVFWWDLNFIWYWNIFSPLKYIFDMHPSLCCTWLFPKLSSNVSVVWIITFFLCLMMFLIFFLLISSVLRILFRLEHKKIKKKHFHQQLLRFSSNRGQHCGFYPAAAELWGPSPSSSSAPAAGAAAASVVIWHLAPLSHSRFVDSEHETNSGTLLTCLFVPWGPMQRPHFMNNRQQSDVFFCLWKWQWPQFPSERCWMYVRPCKMSEMHRW